MAQPLNPEVKLAFVHQSIVVPGIIGSEKTLSEAKIKGLKMYWTPQGLRMEVKGIVVMVPHANVVNAVLSDEK